MAIRAGLCLVVLVAVVPWPAAGTQVRDTSDLIEVERAAARAVRALLPSDARVGFIDVRSMTSAGPPSGPQRTPEERAVLLRELDARPIQIPYVLPGCGRPQAPLDCLDYLIRLDGEVLGGDSAVVRASTNVLAASSRTDRELLLRRRASEWIVERNTVTRHATYAPRSPP